MAALTRAALANDWTTARSLQRKYLPLMQANFTGSSLRGANLMHCRASGAVFDKAKLTRCRMQYASLQSASFVEANLDRARLVHADLRNSRLEKALSLFAHQLSHSVVTATV